MDPYLEDPDIWEDFHTELASKIRGQLAPQLRPRYFAALVPRVSYDEVVIAERHVVKPDVAVIRMTDRPMVGEAVAIAPPPLEGVVAIEVEVRSQTIEIRRVSDGELVTAIEILSPVNKRPGREAFEEYRQKRRDLLRSRVHLLEIDLLRGGRRPPIETPLPDDPYFVFLSRGNHRPWVDIWPLRLQEPIPILPVPLTAPDKDVPLDLGQAIVAVYDEAGYDLRIDYSQAPPKPDLPIENAAWVEMQLRSVGLR